MKTKTKKQYQEEFTELTGREATKANVSKEFEQEGLPLPEGKATQTVWWQEVVETIWDAVEARKIIKKNNIENFTKNPLSQILPWADLEKTGYLRLSAKQIISKLGGFDVDKLPEDFQSWTLRLRDAAPIGADRRPWGTTECEALPFCRITSTPFKDVWRVYADNDSAMYRLEEIFGSKAVHYQFPVAFPRVA